MLSNLTNVVPELATFANLHLEVAFNKDSCRVGPPEWTRLARLLHSNRAKYDAFMIVHGIVQAVACPMAWPQLAGQLHLQH